MKICFIGKYPPIQGGVSRDNLWASYALAQEGHNIHIVTNAQEVEYQFRTLEGFYKNHPTESLRTTNNGSVITHYSSRSKMHNHIPASNPLATKLSTMATNVIEEYGCDLIYSYYLEPYSVAAHLASNWTGIPYGIRHAGSDIGRLFQSPDLQAGYERIIRSADYVFTSNSTTRRFLHLGVDFEKLYTPVPSSLPTDYFNPLAVPLDINALLSFMKESLPSSYYNGIFHRLMDKDFDPSLPTIGIYGKTGQAKGSFDLIRALGRLRAEGTKFNFLALTQGYDEAVIEFVKHVEDNALTEVTWLLPFIPHWYIPNFIRACTAICFLERDFPIKIHSPTVPREVFACGTCLILSHEIADKQIYREKLDDRSNVYLVDPRDITDLAAALRSAIQDPESSRQVGIKGYQELSAGLEDFDAYSRTLASTFTVVCEEVKWRRKIVSVAEMQACLARLYVDNSFRALFYFDQDIPLSEYKLSEDESRAIKSLDRKMLDFFAVTLRQKRKKRFQSAFPLLFQSVGTEIDRYYDRYYQLHPAIPDEPLFDYLVSLGRFVEQCLATDDEVPAYACDLARYERFRFYAKFCSSPKDSFKTINDSALHQDGSIPLDAYPYMHQGVQVATFTHDIISIINEINAQLTPSLQEKGVHCLVFQSVPGLLNPSIFAVSPTTRDLIALCDGTHNVLDIIAEMEALVEQADLEGAVHKIVCQLVNSNVLGVVLHDA